MSILIIKRWAEFKENWKLCTGWFLYHFLMVALVVINITFFVTHWKDLVLTPTDSSSLLLTFLGFLFAFAGINIYSIFNTNIESEKSRLNQLIAEYEAKLKDSKSELDRSREIIKLQLTCQMLTGQKQINSQCREWIALMKHILKKVEASVPHLRNILTAEEFNRYRGDMVDVARGASYLLKSFHDEISTTRRVAFFNGLPAADITNTLAEFTELENIITPFVDGSVFDHLEEQMIKKVSVTPLNWKQKIKLMWRLWRNRF